MLLTPLARNLSLGWPDNALGEGLAPFGWQGCPEEGVSEHQPGLAALLRAQGGRPLYKFAWLRFPKIFITFEPLHRAVVPILAHMEIT